MYFLLYFLSKINCIFCFVKDWKTFTEEYLFIWRGFHKEWLSFHGSLLLLVFDDLQNDLQSQVTKMADFLEDPQINMDIDCALSDSTGSSQRNSDSLTMDKDSLFDKDLVKNINLAILETSHLASKHWPEVAQTMTSWLRNVTEVETHRFHPFPKIDLEVLGANVSSRIKSKNKSIPKRKSKSRKR